MTLVETIKKREQQNRKTLLELLQISEDDLALQIFEGAYEYLEKVFGTDAYGLTHLPKTSQFWTWWKMEWNKIDHIFVSAVEEHRTPKGIAYKVRDRDNTQIYCVCHNVQHLRDEYTYYHEAHMNNRYLNSDIVRAGMHNMIDSIVNQSVEKNG